MELLVPLTLFCLVIFNFILLKFSCNKTTSVEQLQGHSQIKLISKETTTKKQVPVPLAPTGS